MKKLTNVFAVAAFICAMTFTMTACGEEDVDSDSAVSQTSDSIASLEAGSVNSDSTDNTVSTDAGSEAADSAFPEVLADVEVLPIPDLSYTGWTFAGGMADGQEMEEADVQQILDACGGVFIFIFGDSGNVEMMNGEASFPGTYSVTADGYIIDTVFEGFEYYGALTNVEEEPVLILVNKQDSTVALYMIGIEG